MSILLIIAAAIAAGAAALEGLLNQNPLQTIAGITAYRAVIAIHHHQMQQALMGLKNPQKKARR